MKKFLMMLLSCAVLAGSVNAMPARKSSTDLAVIKNGSVFKVVYQGGQTGTVKVKIFNASRTLVFTETLKNTDSFIRPYNFSSLAEGDYVIEVNDGRTKQVEKVSFTKGQIERFMSIHALKESPGKLMLIVPNKGDDVFTVRIYDSSGTLLFKHTASASGDFAMVYNLKNLNPKGSFEVTDKRGVVQSLSF
jgi:hypothetical protein